MRSWISPEMLKSSGATASPLPCLRAYCPPLSRSVAIDAAEDQHLWSLARFGCLCIIAI